MNILVDKINENIRVGLVIHNEEDLTDGDVKNLKELKKNNEVLTKAVLEARRNGDLEKYARERLVLPTDNVGYLYSVKLVMSEKEFKNHTDILTSMAYTVHVHLKLNIRKIFISFNARSEEEIYIFLRALVDEDVNFEEMLINRFPKQQTGFSNLINSGAKFDKDTVKELMDNDVFDLDQAIEENLNENFITMDDDLNIRLNISDVRKLIDNPARLYSERFNVELDGKDLSQAAFAIYMRANTDYRHYVIVFTYLLLNIKDKKVKRFFEASKIRDDEDKMMSSLNEALEDLGFTESYMDYTSIIFDINSKVSQSFKKKAYGDLNLIMDIVDSSLIMCMKSFIIKTQLEIQHYAKKKIEEITSF